MAAEEEDVFPEPDRLPPSRGGVASNSSDLDEFVTELRDRIDECEGSLLHLDGTTVWVHTPKQIDAWIGDAVEAWRGNNYQTLDELASVSEWPRGQVHVPDGWPHNAHCPITHAARALANGYNAGTVGCRCLR
jgi:hypothetical protein